MTMNWPKFRLWRMLFTHFFEGFIYGEMDNHDDRKWGQACLVLMAIAGCNLYTSWALFSGFSEVFSLNRLWISFAFLLALQMIMSGIFVLISWHNIFLTPRDHENLAHLPVPMSAIVTAKIAVVLFVLVLLSLIHIVSVTPVILGFTQGKIDVSAFRYGWAIFRYFLWGNAWIFFALASLLGTCQYLSRWRFGAWLFHIFHIGGISLFMGVLFYLPRMMVMAANEAENNAEWSPLTIPFLFVEKIKAALHMPVTAVVSEESHFLDYSSIGIVFLTLFFISLIFRRFQTNSRKRPPAGSKKTFAFFNWVGWRLIGRLMKNPPERGLFFFMKKTFFKNRFLWIFLILLWTPLFGLLVVQTLSDDNASYLNVFSGKQSEGVLVGIALGFLLVFFSRLIFKQTVILKANWIWQALPSISLATVFHAIMKVLFFVFSPLLWLFMILIYTSHWQLAPALLFCLGFWPMYISITATLFFAYDSIIPFTGFRHQEGEPHSINTWPFYLLISVIYILVARWVALWLINAPEFLILFILIVFLIIWKIIKRWERKAFVLNGIYEFE